MYLTSFCRSSSDSAVCVSSESDGKSTLTQACCLRCFQKAIFGVDSLLLEPNFSDLAPKSDYVCILMAVWLNVASSTVHKFGR